MKAEKPAKEYTGSHADRIVFNRKTFQYAEVTLTLLDLTSDIPTLSGQL